MHSSQYNAYDPRYRGINHDYPFHLDLEKAGLSISVLEEPDADLFFNGKIIERIML
jgi:hypothetical protein